MADMLALLQGKGTSVYRNPDRTRLQLDMMNVSEYSRKKAQALAIGFVTTKITGIAKTVDEHDFGSDSESVSGPRPTKKSKLDLACKKHKQLIRPICEAELWLLLAASLAQNESLLRELEEQTLPSRYCTVPPRILHTEENIVSLRNAAACQDSDKYERMHSCLMHYAFNGPPRQADFPGTCKAFAVLVEACLERLVRTVLHIGDELAAEAPSSNLMSLVEALCELYLRYNDRHYLFDLPALISHAAGRLERAFHYTHFWGALGPFQALRRAPLTPGSNLHRIIHLEAEASGRYHYEAADHCLLDLFSLMRDIKKNEPSHNIQFLENSELLESITGDASA